MSAGARVLHHQGVHALFGRPPGLGRGGDSGQHRRPRPLQGADDVGAREPEGETDQLHGIRQQGIDLAPPLVVVIQPQLRELHAVTQGIGTQPLPVLLEPRQHGAADGASWAGSGTNTFMPNRAPDSRMVRISACMAATLL